MNEPIYITGMGAMTSMGDLANTWQGVLQGERGFQPITTWPLGDWPYVAGELKHYEPRKMIPDPKILKLLSRQDVIGLHAAGLAIEDSRLLEARAELPDPCDFNDKTGIYVGSPGNKFFQQYDFMPLLAHSGASLQTFADQMFSLVHPMWLLKILPNNVLAYTGIFYGFKGANQNISNHAASGLQAVTEAFWAIKTGQIDRAVVVAYDLGFDPQSLLYYAELGVVSLKGEIKPFDKAQDGTLLAEGAGALVLESARSAEARQARVYGQILGGSSSSEARGILPVDATGAPLLRTLQRALSDAKLPISELGMVTAHGNANRRSDQSEAGALGALFGEAKIPIAAFKWSFGHTLTAAGILDLLCTVCALRDKSVPGIATFNEKALYCEDLSISNLPQPLTGEKALVIARGLGGINSCVIVSL